MIHEKIREIKAKLKQHYNNRLLKHQNKKEKIEIARNLEESTKHYNLKTLKQLRKIYDNEEPSELDKAFMQELDRIIARKQRLAKLKWNS